MDRGTLSELIEAARFAQPFTEHAPGGDLDRAVRIPKIAGVNGRVDLAREFLPSLMDADGRITRAPVAAPGGETITLAAAAAGFSRVIAAGSHLIRLPDEIVAIPTGKDGVVVFPNRPAGLRLIDPANFEALALDPVTGEGEVSAVALPTVEALIDRDALTQRVVRFEIKRGVRKDRAPGELEAEIMTALALGVGRALDHELLTAIVATTPAAYTASAAASLGLNFGELRAIVGTAGAGAAPDRGELFVQGIPAELTADVAETIVGAFTRAAVVYHDHAEILVERRSAAGDLVITAWLGMAALVPKPGAFWAVS